MAFPFYFISTSGLRYNKKTIAASAQTERWSEAWPVRGVAWLLDPHRPFSFTNQGHGRGTRGL